MKCRYTLSPHEDLTFDLQVKTTKTHIFTATYKYFSSYLSLSTFQTHSSYPFHFLSKPQNPILLHIATNIYLHYAYSKGYS